MTVAVVGGGVGTNKAANAIQREHFKGVFFALNTVPAGRSISIYQVFCEMRETGFNSM